MRVDQKVRSNAYGNGQAYRLYDRDTDDANGVLDGTSFGQWQAAYNAVVNDGGADGDGIGDPDDDPDYDGDQNGVYDTSESSMYVNTLGRPSFDYGEISRSDPGGVDNQIGYAGYVFNREQKFYTVRYRSYSPADGRWWQRDPIGFYDGMSLYEYINSAAVDSTDAFGLADSITRYFQSCMKKPPLERAKCLSAPFHDKYYRNVIRDKARRWNMREYIRDTRRRFGSSKTCATLYANYKFAQMMGRGCKNGQTCDQLMKNLGMAELELLGRRAFDNNRRCVRGMSPTHKRGHQTRKRNLENQIKKCKEIAMKSGCEETIIPPSMNSGILRSPSPSGCR